MSSSFQRQILSVLIVLLGSIGSQLPALAEQPAASPEQLKYFETHIRPLFVERCYKCHGEKKQSGDLRVDSRGALLLGGESGPAIDTDAPEASLLLEAVRYESFEMPPDGKLSDEEIAHLAAWVAMGSPWPGGEQVAMTRPQQEKISDEDRQFWSFQPLVAPAVPQLSNDDWSRSDIDRFILQELRAHDLQPAPPVDKLTLIRRLYYDMVGLPPTLEQIDRFLADDSPEAYSRVVDDVLSSSGYGEHWARFWLDLVRYAESDGFRQDAYRPTAWRYRDYVIQSFNEDKPYDQFVREQIAGDEIAPDNPEALAATGFMRHGIYEYNQRDAITQWQDILNDITDTTADVFLGMGMGCARCHDHKFDPILQEDYFRLQAFFANISLEDTRPLATSEQVQMYADQLAKWEAATVDIRRQLDEMERKPRQQLSDSMARMFPEDVQEMWFKPEAERTAYERQICQLVEFQVIDKLSQLPSKFRGEDKKRWEELKAELAKFDELKPAALPAGRTAHDFPVDPPPVYIPGKERRGAIPPGFLTIFEPAPVSNEALPALPQSSGRRTVLADWLTRPDHPLTTRVIVNRIWQQHFGTGIVSTPSDFGHLGEAPSHPELLDWLAI
ncbi:MAG: DUF1549 domain-containing protein, partial [Planctomycetaceae bacterium]|nr:DUF1549 domain-containing protein [Planctomycetaceae bacterium]